MALSPNPALVQAIQAQTPDPKFQTVLLATALAESGGRLDAVGDNGNSGGPYQENSYGRGHGIPMTQRFDPVASTARAYREFSQLRADDPGQWAARAQRPADPVGYAAKVRALIPAAQGILRSGGRAAAQVGTQRASTALSPIAGGLTPASLKLVGNYLRASEQAVLAGQDPPDVMGLVNRLQFSSPATPSYAPAAASYGGPISPLPNGGGWAGTQAPVSKLAELSGLKITSAKRSTKMTASGHPSDHWVGTKNGYANDLGWGGERPTPQSDAAASRIVSALGGPADWGKTGGVFNTTINGVRYQILYRTNTGGNHWNHIHVGARRVG